MSERRGNASEGEMVHGGLVEEALRVWRDGERLLEELPPLTADHEGAAERGRASGDVSDAHQPLESQQRPNR